MNLTVPGVGTEGSPAYAQEINNDLSIVDAHNHSAGSGVQITPDGININAALTLNSNFLIDAAGMTLIAQGSTPVNSTVYQSGTDLYFVDGVGNNVRLTQSGAVAGTPGSISNLVSPASAAYVSVNSTFVWQSDANIAANLDAAALLMRNITPNSTFALTLQPPVSLAANYSLTLPALPASQKIMTLDNAGTMSAPYTVDGSTITIATNVIGIPAGGVGTTQLANQAVTTAIIANGSVTKPKLAALGQVISSSSGAYSTTSTSTVAITNLSVSITTSGRPVILMAIPDGATNGSEFRASSGSTAPTVIVSWFRGASDIADFLLRSSVAGVTGVQAGGFMPVQYFDPVAAGTYTYTLRATCASGSSFAATNIKIVAYEL